jgi:hypothetical protein
MSAIPSGSAVDRAHTGSYLWRFACAMSSHTLHPPVELVTVLAGVRHVRSWRPCPPRAWSTRQLTACHGHQPTSSSGPSR